MSRKPTYVYREKGRNLLLGLDLFARIRKVENWRIGNENSEDALTWNVVLGAASLNLLDALLECLTGDPPRQYPELYLWGNRFVKGGFQVWERLDDVRRELEDGLAIQTEPDIVLRVPGDRLVCVEAKLSSPNATLAQKQDRFGDVYKFLDRYRAPDGRIDPVDRNAVSLQEPEVVLEQLLRNAVFASWLAVDQERPMVVNLVRATQEHDVAPRVQPILNPEAVTFRRATWEDVGAMLSSHGSVTQPLTSYMRNKTVNLERAFDAH